ncbi:MAG: type VI secretion system baseplate subunit TssK [Planctomycetales bacterium]|nr:type VI secretion system baseplate subunit TssK [Planctomycetales bacterium]
MRTQPVHWYEGMFLRPQHFQAGDRYWHDSLATAMQWQTHYAYGLRSFRLQRDALGANFFQLNGCQAVLRDGTLIDLEGRDLRVSLKEVFQKQSEVTVLLAVSKLVLGRPNTGDPSVASTRLTVASIPVVDENTGGNENEIEFRQLHVRLLLSTDSSEGYETLPLARIKRSGGEEATPEIDDDYIPPLLAVDAWQELSQGIVRAIYDLLGQKADVLAQRATSRGLSFSSQEPGDLDDLWMLSHINQALATLHSLTFANGLHPYTVYLELCRTVGMLSIFEGSRRLDPQLPAYDHDDLATVFLWLKRKIGELIGSSKKLEYEQRFFVGVEQGMQVSLEPKWLHATWKWYVGVHGENVPAEICRELLRPGVLDWKMGSNQQVELLFKHRMPDVKAEDELRSPPRALPTQRGWIYFEVRREGPAWKDVLATQSLAMRFNTNVIANLDRLSGQRKLEVIYREKRAILEFALFAVPTSNP